MKVKTQTPLLSGLFLIISTVMFLCSPLTTENQTISNIQEETLHYSSPHAPIYIDGDVALTTFPDKTGSGTELDPYVIRDMEIDAGGVVSAIEIQHTTLYLQIVNCTLWGATGGLVAGVRLYQSNNVLVTNCTIYNCAYGFYHGYAHNNTYAYNTIHDCESYGMYLMQSDYNTFIGNVVTDNFIRGMFLTVCHNATILDNVIMKHNYGLYLENSLDGIIENNVASNHTYYGFYNRQSSRQIWKNNTAFQNSYHGFYVYNSQNVTLSRNNAYLNTQAGLYLSGATRVVADNNNFSNNQASGIYISNSHYSWIHKNVVCDNNVHGIYMTGTSANNTVYYNTLEGNVNNQADCGASGINNVFDFDGYGNFWGDYSTKYPAATNDGTIWNTPYTIPSSILHDNFPLVYPYSHYRIYIDGNAALDAFCAGNGTDGLTPETAHVIARYTIDSYGVTSGINIRNTDRYLVIENCDVFNATAAGTAGIYLYYSSNVLISSCTTWGNFYGIRLYHANNNIVDRNTVTGNLDNALDLYWSDSNNLTSNNVSGNIGRGFSIQSSDFCIFLDNIAHKNAHGFYFDFTYDSIRFERNIASNNTYHGFYFRYSTNNPATNNTAIGNGYSGIQLFGATGSHLTNNLVMDSGDYGISVADTNDTVVRGNVALRSGYANLQMSDAYNNTFVENIASDGEDVGLIMAGGTGDNKIYLNAFSNNTLGNTNYLTSGNTNQFDNGVYGNYWDDYVPRYPSAVNDGTVWLTPYQIDISAYHDLHPLVHPRSRYPFLIDGDAALDAFCAGNGTDGLSWDSAHHITGFVINATGPGGSCVEVRNITRFLVLESITVTNTTVVGQGGIKITNATGGLLITSCTAMGNVNGFLITYSSNVIITSCTINNNLQSGLWIDHSTLCNVTGNHFNNNNISVRITESSNHTCQGNVIKGGFQGINVRIANDVVVKQNDIHVLITGIIINNTNNLDVIGNNISGSSNYGFYLMYSDIGVIKENQITSCARGLSLEQVTGQIVTLNNVTYNNIYGISFTGSGNDNSKVYQNIFADNTPIEATFTSLGSTSFFDDGKALGNYWGNYTTTYPSAIHNGYIWTTPYQIRTRFDRFPLVDASGIYMKARAPIYIDGNAALDAFCAGNGTDGLSLETAHVIKDYYISSITGTTCITIRNTDRYLRIQNCTLYNGTSASSSGVYLYATQRINVSSCTIMQCYDGLRLENTVNSILFSLNVSKCVQNGMYVSTSDYNQILNCVFVDNGIDNGIYFVTGSEHNTVSGCTITDQDKCGVYIISGSNNNTVKDSVFARHVWQGVRIESSTSCLIINNTIPNCMSGVYIAANGNNISNNRLLSNTWHGVFLTASQNNFIENNYIWNNTQNGVNLQSNSLSNTIRNNTILENDNYAIFLSASDGNYVLNNTASYTYLYGVYLYLGSDSNIVRYNVFSYNSRGVSISSSSNNIVEYNVLTGNTAYGLQASSAPNSYFNHNELTGPSDPITITASDDSTVINNTINGGSSTGIQVQTGSDRVIVENNTIYSCLTGAIRIVGGTQNQVINNTCFQNSFVGIRAEVSASYTQIINNTVYNNPIGIELNGVTFTIIHGNRIWGCSTAGILVGSSNNNTLGCNEVFSNFNGVNLDSCSNNTVYNNTIYSNTNNDLIVQGTSTSNLIFYNEFNSTIPLVSSVAGNSWDNGSRGNHWKDYESRYPGATNDGLVWLTPYEISSGITFDHYPIVGELFPNVSFSESTSSIIAGQFISFNFTGTLGNAPSTFFWDFGDGYNATTMDVVHQFLVSGNYTVTLTVNDTGGDVDSDAHLIEVILDEHPVASFIANPTGIIAGQSVQFAFTGSTGNAPTTYFWEFGDGTNSTLQNPAHAYSSSGTYTVSLMIQDIDGDINVTSVIDYIDVVEDLSPLAFFYFNTTSIVSGQEVEFIFDGDEGNAPAWVFWRFGDGDSINASASVNVTHQYTSVGFFTVNITVGDVDGDTHTFEIPSAIEVITDEFPVAIFSASGTSIVQGQSVEFSFVGLNGNEPTTFWWDFGDGTNSSLQNPIHQYLDSGTFSINFTVRDRDGDIDFTSATNYITVDVDASPISSFSTNVTEIIAGQSVQFNFTGSQGNPNATFFWTFGDGSNSTIQDPVHQYLNQGNYTVSLNVTDTDGDWDQTEYSSLIDVMVDLYPVAAIGSNWTVFVAGQSVIFSYTGTTGNEPATFWWDFGDGDNSTLRDPTHQYLNPGNFTVTVIIIDVDGDKDNETIDSYVDIEADLSPVASLSSNASVIVAGQEVKFYFTGSEGNGPASFFWVFGDGFTSVARDPAHQYNVAGNYSVNLTVTDRDGDFQAGTLGFNITVEFASTPTASFLSNTTLIVEGQSVLFMFDGISGNEPVQYQWDFGDLTGNSTGSMPVHQYNSSGNYTVTLTVIDFDGDESTLSISSFIDVMVEIIPAASFHVNDSNIIANQFVQFTFNGTLGNPVTQFQWNFGDSPANSTDPAPSHQYTVAGIYTVILTITDFDGDTSTSRVTGCVNVVEDDLPVAMFEANWTDIVESQFVEFNFTGDYGNAPTIFFWDFGDGTNSTLEKPTHQYQNAGNYTVNLTVSDVDGDVHSTWIMNYIGVIGDIPAVAGFSANWTGIIEGQFVLFSFDGNSGNGPTVYFWDFGDGSNSSLRDPVHQYISAGNYTVFLNVTDRDHDVSTHSQPGYIHVQIDLSPDIAFTANRTLIIAGQSTEFSYTGSDGNAPAQFQWNFGDGTGNSTARNPVHQFSSAGNFTVALTVSDVDGDTVTTTIVSFIDVMFDISPSVTYSANMSTTYTGHVVQFTFTGVAGNEPATFSWNFGDGTAISGERNPVHVFSTSGIMTVMLSIIDADGDTALRVEPGFVVVIQDSMPVVSFIANASVALLGQDIQYSFTGSGGNTPLSFQWNFGDASGNSTVQDTLHQFSSVGSYTVTLTVSDASGDVISLRVTNFTRILARLADDDGDGLTNEDEMLVQGTNPLLADTDGDGFSDGIEDTMLTDPLDPMNSPLTLWIMPGGVALLISISIGAAKSKKKRLNKARKTKGADEKKSAMTAIPSPKGTGIVAGIDSLASKKMKGQQATSAASTGPVVDDQVEKEVDVEVKVEKCIVCDNPLKGTSYICPKCGVKYCLRCSKALAERDEPCWQCKDKINVD